MSMSVNQALYQNLRVWTRRLDLEAPDEIKVPHLVERCLENDINPGSRRAALFLIAVKYFLSNGVDKKTAVKMGVMVSEVGHRFMYREQAGNILQEVVKTAGTRVPPHRHLEVAALVSQMMGSRMMDRTKPNFANLILNKARAG